MQGSLMTWGAQLKFNSPLQNGFVQNSAVLSFMAHGAFLNLVNKCSTALSLTNENRTASPDECCCAHCVLGGKFSLHI